MAATVAPNGKLNLNFGVNKAPPFRPRPVAVGAKVNNDISDKKNTPNMTNSTANMTNGTSGDPNDMTAMSHVFALEVMVTEELSDIRAKLAPLLSDYEARTGTEIVKSRELDVAHGSTEMNNGRKREVWLLCL